jgi:hypothetical protein
MRTIVNEIADYVEAAVVAVFGLIGFVVNFIFGND